MSYIKLSPRYYPVCMTKDERGMMTDIQVFKNPEFGEIRTIEENGEPWFVAKDIASALGYMKPRNAVYQHVAEEDRGSLVLETPGGKQPFITINESGLYSLILSSKLDSAKKFKRWVTSEVLPTIRKHGAYLTDKKAESLFTQEGLADLLMQAGQQLKEKELIIQTMQPKALFADAVSSSRTTILIGDLAKLLKQNGYDTGQKRLFQQLREEGFLIKRQGTDYNSPTQRAMEMGLFEIKEGYRVNADGTTVTTKTTKVTGKGQVYFINRYIGKNKSSQDEFVMAEV